MIARRLFVSAFISASSLVSHRLPAWSEEANIRFEADDQTFTFDLPSGWVGVTRPEQERASDEHLISVRAQRLDGAASLQAIVDGGTRGRRYGTSVKDLGPLEAIADRLVSDELLGDEQAKSASVVSAERRNFRGVPYYVVRYQVGFKPAVAKLAIVQQRLYVLRVRATKPADASAFFADATAGTAAGRGGGLLRAEMEGIAESYTAAPVNFPCLDQSNKLRVPAAGECRVLRP